MSYDLIIKNGTVVDGTGAARYQADVAVANGKIAEIGKITDGAKQTIDASDLVVAPGFVDPHTHYDAQICWDPLITSSSWHGVTSLIMGNCGVGLAPCKPEVRDIAAWDLVNVEAIPFDVLAKGIKWEWETFPQYMDAAAKRGSGINLGFLAPLTPFRPAPLRQQVRLRTAAPQVAIVVFPEGLRAGVVMPIEIPHPAKCRRSAGLDLLILRDQEPPFLNVVPLNRPIEAVVPHLNPPRTG